MSVRLLSWPFKLRRICSKWYTFAALICSASAIYGLSVLRNETDSATVLFAALLFVYSGISLVSTLLSARAVLSPLGLSLREIRQRRIPVIEELRRYPALIAFIVLLPILIAGIKAATSRLAEFDIALTNFGIGLVAFAFFALVIAGLYILFRWQTAANWKRAQAKDADFSLYLRSFASDAASFADDNTRFRWVTRALGRIFSLERLVVRALLERG